MNLSSLNFVGKSWIKLFTWTLKFFLLANKKDKSVLSLLSRSLQPWAGLLVLSLFHACFLVLCSHGLDPSLLVLLWAQQRSPVCAMDGLSWMILDGRQGQGWCRAGTTPNLHCACGIHCRNSGCQGSLTCCVCPGGYWLGSAGYTGLGLIRIIWWRSWSTFWRPLWQGGRQWSPAQLMEAAGSLRCSVGVPVLLLTQTPRCVGPPSPLGLICKFPTILVTSTLAFGSALAFGWSWSLAISVFTAIWQLPHPFGLV